MASNLSLGALYGAWNGTARAGAVSSSLNAANGLAGTPVSMSSFIVGNVAATLPFTYIVENTAENVTFAFTGQGLAFDNRIKIQSANYTITVSDNTYFSVGSKGATTAITAANLGGTTYSGSNATTLTAYFNDGYNTATGNFGSGNAASKTIYSVDSYNGINSDALCVSTDTDILLADGTSVKAGDLYVGDTIKTFVPKDMPNWLPENDPGEWYWWYNESGSNGDVVDATVGNIYFSFIDQYVSINGGAIKATHAHPFFVYDALTETYQFTRAEDVAEGDALVKYNTKTGKVENVLVELVEFVNKTLEIATITIDVAHTYLANGFVSHNKGAATAPIPWTNLVCYLDTNFTASYTSGTNYNDLSGYSTGFNLTGGSANPAIAAPTLNAGPPKSLQFASGKYGIKQIANTSGTGYANFNTTSANGFTIIALVNGSAGNIFSKSTDWTFAASGTTMTLTSTPIGNSTSSTTTLTGWRMLAVTSGNGQTIFYNNGSLVSTATTTAANTNAVADIYLMQNNTGALGGFLFYQRALSSAEITAIYNNFHTRTSYV